MFVLRRRLDFGDFRVLIRGGESAQPQRRDGNCYLLGKHKKIILKRSEIDEKRSGGQSAEFRQLNYAPEGCFVAGPGCFLPHMKYTPGWSCAKPAPGVTFPTLLLKERAFSVRLRPKCW